MFLQEALSLSCQVCLLCAAMMMRRLIRGRRSRYSESNSVFCPTTNQTNQPHFLLTECTVAILQHHSIICQKLLLPLCNDNITRGLDHSHAIWVEQLTITFSHLQGNKKVTKVRKTFKQLEQIEKMPKRLRKLVKRLEQMLPMKNFPSNCKEEQLQKSKDAIEKLSTLRKRRSCKLKR